MISYLQINIDGEWTTLASFEQRSAVGNTWLEYDHDYVIGRKDSPHNRAGLLYPVNFEIYTSAAWPAFLVDILPSGAGRRVWLRRLGIPDNESNDLNWRLLLNGAGNPPGNLRIIEAIIATPDVPHAGFTIDEIVQKNTNFIEYAEEMGAVVAGATDIPGDAPKFMVTRDHNGRWHPDGSIADNEVAESWIVKFPRGKEDRDYIILRNEAQYYEVARWFGIRTGANLVYRDNSLFIPRFDRIANSGKLIRYGMETMCSVADIPEYGRRGDHAQFCAAIAKVSTNAKSEIFEYLKRDILNVAMRNVDNHGRNTAFIKRAGENIELSPLFDFAPMFLDPSGIPRATLWKDGIETRIGRPDWVGVIHSISDFVDTTETTDFLLKHVDLVAEIPAQMKKYGVEEFIIGEVAHRCEEISADLKKVR